MITPRTSSNNYKNSHDINQGEDRLPLGLVDTLDYKKKKLS